MVSYNLHISTCRHHAYAQFDSRRKVDGQEFNAVSEFGLILSTPTTIPSICMIHVIFSRKCSEVPRYKQRIAGKSLPMEKFTIKKANRFFVENESLVLPALELMYIWNVFNIIGKEFHLADNILKVLEDAQQKLEARTERTKYDVDNRALVLLLKGACLRQMKSPLQAMKYVPLSHMTQSAMIAISGMSK